MPVTAEAIVSVAPGAAPYAEELVRQMHDIGIDNALIGAHFLGQIHVESGGFTTVTENLNYKTEALLKMFGRHRITTQQAEQYGRNAAHPADQEALANILYGGDFGHRQLGNTEQGDGWRFRGRGLKQLTGRDNYLKFSQSWLGTDELLRRPERVAEPDGAVASAIWFWYAKGLTDIAKTGSVEAVTRRVNGGQNGLDQRRVWTREYMDALS